MPSVSIQIPVYQSIEFLSDALDSLARQTCQDFEILLISDGSVHDLKEIRKSYPRVRYLEQPHLGVASARNLGLMHSRGSVIAFLDADDIWKPDKLQKQLEYLNAHPSCQIVFTAVENICALPPESLNARQAELMSVAPDHCLVSSCIRRQIFEYHGNFLTDLVYGEDTEFLARIGAGGTDLSHTIPETLYQRRIHTDNCSLLHPRVGRREYLQLMASAFRNSRSRKCEND